MNFQFETFTAYQYMAIEVANAYGLDKDDYPIRLKWVKDNIHILESHTDQAGDPFLYRKAVKNLREVQEGKPTGGLVRFDAVCSGIQILSVLTRCIKGCEATGAINTGKRPNAYRQVQRVMGELLGGDIVVSYDDIKNAVMTSCYGSTKEPKKLFNGDELDAFNQACRIVAPGAFNLLPILKGTWDTEKLVHEWNLPDGFRSFVPVKSTDVIRLEIEELGGYRMSTLVTKNVPLDFSVANIANITHSVDGYIVRSLVRYCNYDKNKVEKLQNLIEAELISRSLDGYRDEVDMNLYNKLVKLNLLDISILKDITKWNIHKYHTDILRLLMDDIALLLSYEPFDILTVHDCFACHPNNMNVLRFWYNEILARLSNSTVLEDILSQLYGTEITLKIFEKDIADLIRKNNYGIN